MKRPILLLFLGCVLASPLRAGADGKGGDDFNQFFAQFRSAVMQRNQKKLARMMAPKFDFIRGTGVTPAVVFDGLATDGGRQWANLQDAVRQRVEAQQGTKRLLQCTPTDPAFSCYVVFEQDKQRRWRWQGMIMPTR